MRYCLLAAILILGVALFVQGHTSCGADHGPRIGGVMVIEGCP